MIEFDAAFAARSAQQFVDEVLVEALGATHVSVGENFRFGHKAQGDAAFLSADTRFETRIVELLEVDGEVVSSSHIRGLVLGGAVEYAGRLLGDPFTIAGEVAHGDKRGRELGYPTANLVPDAAFVTPGPRRLRGARAHARRRRGTRSRSRRRSASACARRSSPAAAS